MVVQSGNDASIALAEHVGGSEEAFAQLMNDYATRVGMTGSNFLNSTGLPADGHLTTALDVARLGRAMIRDFPEHYRTYSIKEYTWNGITQHNRNTLLWRDASVDGIKTGHTSRAGYCLAASAQRGDTRMIAVVMGTASEKVRADEAQALLNYGFRVYESRAVYAPGATVAEPRLYKGEAEFARLGVATPLVVTIPRGAYERMQAAISIPAPLLAPLAEGQEIGRLTLSLDGETVAEAPLVAIEARPEGGFMKRLSDSVRIWIDSE
jgi:D-alanyl-D-alanine carboxypeptidase (penicillin-binding protein 5/6)